MTERSGIRRLDRVLPGLSRVYAGGASGAIVPLAWVSLLAVAAWKRQRIAQIIAAPEADGIVALVTMVVLLGITWFFGNRSSRVAPAEGRFGRHRGAVGANEVGVLVSLIGVHARHAQ